jgi:type I restriction enzyme S subunit
MNQSWPKTKLGDVLNIQNGYAFDSKKFNPSTGLPLVRIRSLKAGVEVDTFFDGPYDDRYLVNDGDLLIGMDGEFGCFEWKGGPALLNQRVCRLQGFNGELIPKFLFYGVNDYLKAIEEVTGFTTVKHLSSKQVLEIPFPVPPLSIQKNTVAILDEVFEGIVTATANAEKNLENARELFESYLQGIFSQRGEGWVDRQLVTLCSDITVGHVGSMKSEYKESGIPFLRSQNIKPFRVSMDNAMFIDDNFHRALKKSQLRPGDLAIVRTGYPGTAAVIPPELLDSNCSDLVIVRPGKEINPHFLAAFFNSSFGKQLVLGKIVGAAQKHFNITAAKEVMLHVPPIEKQQSIVAMVDSFRDETESLEAIYTQKLAALDELKKSILHRAFSGQLH